MKTLLNGKFDIKYTDYYAYDQFSFKKKRCGSPVANHDLPIESAYFLYMPISNVTSVHIAIFKIDIKIGSSKYLSLKSTKNCTGELFFSLKKEISLFP